MSTAEAKEKVTTEEPAVGVEAPPQQQPSTGNKKSKKRENNPDAGVGTLKPAVSKRANEEEAGPSKGFAGVSQRDEKRLFTTFKSRKQLWLAEIEKHSAPINTRDEADKSNKGFIDTRCLPIIELLNAHPDYVTTSSCSGRICLFHSVGAINGEDDAPREGEASAEPPQQQQQQQPPSSSSSTAVAAGSSAEGAMKRGAEGSLGWILASHESPLTEEQIQLILAHTVPEFGGRTNTNGNGDSGSSSNNTQVATSSSTAAITADVNGCMVAGAIPMKGQVSLKCEPFLLHVQCRTIEAAKKLLNAAIDAGFRNSGMIPPGKNIMVGIRHASLSIDAPLVADGGISFASEAHVRYLVKVAEEKMAENFRRTLLLEKHMRRWIYGSASGAKDANTVEQ